MLKQKSKIRITRSGNIVKSLKERYLRSEISCGVQNCATCSNYSLHNCESVLNPNLENLDFSTLISHPFVLIPSQEVVLTQMSILEDPSLTNVVVLQTIMENLTNFNRTTTLLKNLKQLLESPDKRFYLFNNEFHTEIYVEKTEEESQQERDNRCIRRAYQWYKSHLEANFNNGLQPIILTCSSQEAHALQSELGLESINIKAFVESISNNENLCEKLNLTALESVNNNSTNAVETTNYYSKEKYFYPSHISFSELQVGIKSGRYKQGIFNSNIDNYLEGTVSLTNPGEDEGSRDSEWKVLISGQQNINRAFDGDIVAVEIFDKELWCAPSTLLKTCEDSLDEKVNEQDDIIKTGHENSGEVSLIKISKRRISDVNSENSLSQHTELSETLDKKQISGKVVGVIRRNWKNYCGTLVSNQSTSSKNWHLFRPLKKSIPLISIETKRASELLTKRICVAIDNWPRTSKYPKGHYISTVGDLGDKDVETETIMMEEGIRYQPFSNNVINCLPNMNQPESFEPEFILQQQPFRRDLRHLDICSIDPPGCTDIDDALHCRIVPKEMLPSSITSTVYEVGVHIADVTQFVKPGTALDEEAYVRGTTVYLTDRRIDMIPELLSSNLCSLRENVDRLAFSVLWYFDEFGNILEEKLPTVFTKSVIRSRRALTYNEAQLILDDPSDNSLIGSSIKMLNHFGRIFRKKRIENGAIILASEEIRFEIDSETSEPLELQKKELLETNRLVEDMMLLANITVAKKIYKHFPSCAVLRCHPKPSKGSFKPLCDLIRERFGVGESDLKKIEDNLNDLLKYATAVNDKYINTLMRILSTRCLQQAIYFSSGSKQLNDFSHYGLAEPIYTHFTSPIRRYPDILVHRLLAASIGILSEHSVNLTTNLSSDKIQQMCDHLNNRNRSARLASWSSLRLHTCLFVKRSPNGQVDESAYIIQLKENAIRVYVPRFGREGIIFFNKEDNNNGGGGQNVVVKVTLNQTESKLLFDDYNIELTKLQRVFIRMAIKTQEVCHIDSLIYSLISPYIPGVSIKVQ